MGLNLGRYKLTFFLPKFFWHECERAEETLATLVRHPRGLEKQTIMYLE